MIGILKETMAAGASVAMVLLSVWLIYEYVRSARQDNDGKGFRLGIWMLGVFFLSFSIEYIGVHTKLVFGAYRYGNILKPAIGTVPVVIGFAWLNMLLTSISVAESFGSKWGSFPFIVKACIIALLMVLFDIIMEPAAVRLGYWVWEGGGIPVQNFVAWFIISVVFMISGYGMGLFKTAIPAIARHGYYAQVIYFLLVNLKVN